MLLNHLRYFRSIIVAGIEVANYRTRAYAEICYAQNYEEHENKPEADSRERFSGAAAIVAESLRMATSQYFEFREHSTTLAQQNLALAGVWRTGEFTVGCSLVRRSAGNIPVTRQSPARKKER